MISTNSAPTHLFWFRKDLRIFDNTALTACCEFARQTQSGVLAVFYITPAQWYSHNMSLWQMDLLLRQIQTIKAQLAQLNIGFVIKTVPDFNAQINDILTLCQTHAIGHIFANKAYLVNELNTDYKLIKKANHLNISTHWYDDAYIVAPNTILTDNGQPYKVFTPFYKRWLAFLDANPVFINPPITAMSVDTNYLSQDNGIGLDDIFYDYYLNNPSNSSNSNNSNNQWLNHQFTQVNSLAKTLYPSDESFAQKRLDEFIADDIIHYDTNRDIPSLNDNQGATSRLSPYLAIGMISPRLCYIKALQKLTPNQATEHSLFQNQKDIYRFISELCWRDFYADVAFVRPDIVKGGAFLALDKAVAWRYDKTDFKMWCQGQTGVPLVDASMRCLNATGFLHNRLRMVVAMYLTKNILIDWRWGERYFMCHLVDGDFASNNGGWQWSASVGTDAEPYFRVMNPFNQADTHDNDAVFIKKWVTELNNVPADIINNESKLQKYLTQNPSVHYPKLATPTKQTRALAIEVFKNAK